MQSGHDVPLVNSFHSLMRSSSIISRGMADTTTLLTATCVATYGWMVV